MEITSCSVQGAAGAGVIAGQESVVAGLGCGGVHRVSLTALHELPDNKDGGVVALREGCDTSKGAGSCGKDRFQWTNVLLYHIIYVFLE